MKDPKETSSAGGVVLNSKGQVLVVSQHGTSWSLPKGHIEPGEQDVTAAAREIREETGITQLDLIKELGSYKRHKIGLDGGEDQTELKDITIFLYITDELDLKPQDPHNPEARWVESYQVANLLTHSKDREFFKSILPEITVYTLQKTNIPLPPQSNT